MSEDFVQLTIADGIARLVLTRPQKRNALTRQMLASLRDRVATIAADSSVRVLTLESEGPVFCAGMDLGEMQSRAGQPNAQAEWQADTEIYRDVIESLFRLPLPTVAIVQGPVLAGGVGLVAACDIVLAADRATVSLPEPKRGITAAVVTPLLLFRIGPGFAGYWLLSGESITAEQAARAGFFHEVVTSDQLPSRREELITSILTGAPSALATSKKTLHDCAAGLLSVQLDVAMRTSAEARETDDAREGLAAFLEKRTPRWAKS